MSAVLERDPRFTEPLYTVDEAAGYLRVPASTFETWVQGYTRHRPTGRTTMGRAFIHALPSTGRTWPTIPFIGLAEGLAARALKDAGVPIKEIREVLPIVEQTIGTAYALATRRLYVEGGRIILDYAEHTNTPALAVVRNQQGILHGTLAEYLRLITFDSEGYAERLTLPGTQRPVVEVSPEVAYGKPTFINGNARMVDIIDRFMAGDPPSDIADDFEVPEDDVMETIRAFYCAPTT